MLGDYDPDGGSDFYETTSSPPTAPEPNAPTQSDGSSPSGSPDVVDGTGTGGGGGDFLGVAGVGVAVVLGLVGLLVAFVAGGDG
jgi:hypothetical protein